MSMKHPVLGCIADDLTGATDLANNLVRAGMRVMLTVDIPAQDSLFNTDAIVVALKSRTVTAAEAVAQSLHACRWLRSHWVHQIYVKICSTFDSTSEGNIGPVTEALMDELGCDFSVAVPSFPDNDRVVFLGHLFVGNLLLSETGMRNHPLTPMTDPNIVRFLQAQVSKDRKCKVGLIDYRTVGHSGGMIRERINELRSQGISIAIADAISNDDLGNLASALRDQPLVIAASGLGANLATTWGFRRSVRSSKLPPPRGGKAILSGSCSGATSDQVNHFIQTGGAAHVLDPLRLASDTHAQVEQALAWADSCWSRNPASPLLVYSTAQASMVKSTHAQLGVGRSGKIVEDAFSAISRGLVARGAKQLVVAGGETSGVCVRALNIQQLQVGPQIDPGVPWCFARLNANGASGLHITLKSGNFGSQDFFTKAFTLLE